MKKTLVIVESPTKARTIGRFLGKDFDVTSSMGHIRDLPASKLGVDVEKNFEPVYVIPPKATKTVNELKKKAKSAGDIILATDEDREGEAIAWHLLSALEISDKKAKRIVFHEITKNAIEKALKSPRKLDENLIDAQQARRVLDRLVGYELSPFLWKKVMRGLSAGRVQSVAVRLIVEREEEIKKFKAEEYWSILANFEPKKLRSEKNGVFQAKLHKIGDKTLKKLDIKSKTEAHQILKDLDGQKYQVSEITKKEVRRNPAPPFTTSTLQQEAARKFGYSAKQTMMLAQQLYEGIDIGEEGPTGLITYMRTDSVNLGDEALASIKTAIDSNFGKEYSLPEPRRYKTKSKGAQEAHEAIRPTDAARVPEKMKSFLDPKQLKIYSLIWKRTLATQMKEAVMDHTRVDIVTTSLNKEGREGGFTFRATGQVIKFDGFLKIYEEGKDDKQEEEEVGGILPEMNEQDILQLLELLPKQSFTQPPPRYTDATLIKALEENGIGRPSTYAPTISTIIVRKYVEKIEKKFHPTDIGTTVNEMLTKHFPKIVDIAFTAKMEGNLDDVAEGKIGWRPMIKEFYEPFKANLDEKSESVEKHVEQTDEKCPICGKAMVIKYGRFGKFMACTDYPNCKGTKQLPEEEQKQKELAEKTKDEKCPTCGKAMDIKRGKWGYFLGCSDYPNCKGIKKIENKVGIKCPKCGQGDVVQKKNRRGTFFYACNRYPDCDYTANKLPGSEDEEDKDSEQVTDNKQQ